MSKHFFLLSQAKPSSLWKSPVHFIWEKKILVEYIIRIGYQVNLGTPVQTPSNGFLFNQNKHRATFLDVMCITVTVERPIACCVHENTVVQPFMVIIKIYSFMCCFSKWEHITHYKAENWNTVKNNNMQAHTQTHTCTHAHSRTQEPPTGCSPDRAGEKR